MYKLHFDMKFEWKLHGRFFSTVSYQLILLQKNGPKTLKVLPYNFYKDLKWVLYVIPYF